MFAMRIDGLKELAATLNELAVRPRKKVLVEALSEIAEPIRMSASSLAPHEPGAPDLRANIVVSRKDRTADDDGGLVKQDEFQATVAIGPSRGFFYGFYQEFGTSQHASQAFMRPAFDGGVVRAIARFAEIIWRVLSARGIHRPTIDAPSVPTGPGRTV